MDIATALMGLAIGFLVGLTGVGGAALLTPVLLLIGVNPTIAVGTDLFYNSVTKFFGAIQHFRQKTVHLGLVKKLAIGSLPGAVAAIAMLKLFDAFFQNAEDVIKFSMGVMLVVVAAVTILRQLFDRKLKHRSEDKAKREVPTWLTIAIGFGLGFLVGLTSIGSGSLFAIALIYLYRLNTSQVVGTDIAHAFLLVTVAGGLHAGLGHVDFMLAFNLLIGSVPGVLLGSTLSAKVPARPLRTVVATLILISGIKLL